MAIYDKAECNCGELFDEEGNCPKCDNVFHMDYMVFHLGDNDKIMEATETDFPEHHRDKKAVIVETHGLSKNWRYLSIEQIRERCELHIVSDPGR